MNVQVRVCQEYSRHVPSDVYQPYDDAHFAAGLPQMHCIAQQHQRRWLPITLTSGCCAKFQLWPASLRQLQVCTNFLYIGKKKYKI